MSVKEDYWRALDEAADQSCWLVSTQWSGYQSSEKYVYAVSAEEAALRTARSYHGAADVVPDSTAPGSFGVMMGSRAAPASIRVKWVR